MKPAMKLIKDEVYLIYNRNDGRSVVGILRHSRGGLHLFDCASDTCAEGGVRGVRGVRGEAGYFVDFSENRWFSSGYEFFELTLDEFHVHVILGAL